MNFKKASIICLALLMVLVIGLGQVSATDLDNNNGNGTLTVDSESADNVNQAEEIDVQEVSSGEAQAPVATSDDEVLSDYTPDPQGIYVSPAGSDSNAGTYDNPYGTIQYAINQATAGKTIYLAGGTYLISSSINIDKTLDFVGYDGTTPVIDAQNQFTIITTPKVSSGTSGIEFSFTNVTFTHGKATNGGVFDFGDPDKRSPYTYFPGKAYFTNCTFIENTAQYGGVFCSWYNGNMAEYATDGDYINVYSCAFINNTATSSGSIFYGSGMGAPTFKYCIAIGNTNYMIYTNNGRNYEIKDSFWQTNSPTSSMIEEGSMDWGNNAKLTLVSDVDQITIDEQAVFTAKLVRSNGADYGENVLFANVPMTFTVTSGSLSETSTVMVNKKGIVTFTPTTPGQVTVTATLGGQSVSKTITVVGLPLYVSSDAQDGEGNGSLANPYSMSDAVDQVNMGASSKIEMLEGNYTFNTKFAIANDVSIKPYKEGVINIVAKNGFLNIMADKKVSLENVTVSGLSAYSDPVFKLASNAKLDILYSEIKDNKITMGAAIIADVASGAELNIGYTLIHDNTAMVQVQSMYGALFNNLGTITANNNWWGSNTVPSGDKLYFGTAPTINSWFIVQQTQDKTVLRTEWTSTITTKLVKNDESAVDDYLHDLTGTYTTNTGNLSESSFILSAENGFTATVDISGATEPANVVTKVNSQSLTASYQYEVPMTEIFIAVDGDDDAGTGTIDAPFQSLGRALEIAKEAGCTIYLLPGTFDAAVLCRGITTGYDPYIIDQCNFTLISYNGPVVIDRTNLYKVLRFAKNTNIEINNLTFINGINKYANYGAIHTSGNLTVRNCLFTDGIGGGFAEYVCGDGAAHVYIYDSNFTNTCVYDEKYSDACVFITGADATLYMNNCRFENNGFYRNFTDPDTHGGIIIYNPNHNEACLRVQKGVATVEGCYFYNNTGVSMIYDKGFVTAKDSYFVSTCMDPALKIVSYGKGYSVDGCYFINNTGGAIGVGAEQWIINNDLEVRNSFFYNNSAEKGGAIHLDKAGALIENCYFEGNNATDGGAIYNSYADLLILHCEFYNNSAANKGGSIFTTGDQDYISIEGNLFNVSQAGTGGVIYSEGITTLFNNEMHNGVAENGSYIYNANRIGNTYVKIQNNETVIAKVGEPITLNATLTDDMANPISGGNIVFIIENQTYEVESVQGCASYTYVFNTVGSYYVDGNYTGNRRYITVAGGATVNVEGINTVLNVTDLDVKIGKDATIIANLTDEFGRPLAGQNITVAFNGETINATTNADGIATATLNTKDLAGGLYDISVKFDGAGNYNATEFNSQVDVKFNGVIKISMIDALKLTAVLTDEKGNPIVNATVFYTIDDGEAVNVTTNGAGEFVCDIQSDCVLTMSYARNNESSCNATITLKNIARSQKATMIEVPSTMTKTAVDYKAGEKGTMFYFYLKDADGKPLANKAIKIGIFDKIYTVKTDSNGRGGLQINIANANYYTYAITFLGDDDYKASFAVCSLQIVKKSVTITPVKTSYTFKASAKTKTITATLKSTNSYIPKGKQVTLTIAGKTFKATVGDKGQISLNVGSVTAKGTYKVAIKFAGTNTYAAATSKTITVKIS